MMSSFDIKMYVIWHIQTFQTLLQVELANSLLQKRDSVTIMIIWKSDPCYHDIQTYTWISRDNQTFDLSRDIPV